MRLPQKLLLAAPVLIVLYLYGLTGVGMLGPDEPRYAAVGREMARSGDWITPRLWGDAWFEKPALLYWLIAIGNSIGLGDELAPRLPVALLSIGFLVFFFYRMLREWGERAAWYATGLLATSAGWITYSHVAVTDLPLAAAFSASIFLALPWIRSGGRRGLLFSGALLGVAALTKGLVPLVLILPLLWVGRQRWRDLGVLAGGTIAVAVPWYFLCWLRNGSEFIDTFFLEHHFGRFFSREMHHVQPWWFYLPVLAGLLFPWTPVLAALKGMTWNEPRRRVLLGVVVFGLVFFSVSANKLPGYILPLLPALAAILGVRLAENQPRRVFAASALLLLVIPFVAAVLPEALASGLSRASLEGLDGRAVALFSLAPVAVLMLERRRSAAAFATIACSTAAAVLYLMGSTFDRINQLATAKPWWERSVAAAQTECIDQLDRTIRYGYYYYAGRELPPCPEPSENNHGILDRNRGVRR